MIRNCLKCGHTNTNATGDSMESCPSCGAIYSKVEAIWAQRPAAAEKSVVSSPAAARSKRHAHADDMAVAAFVDGMRAESLYPTFRVLVQLGYWVWMGFAALALIGAVSVLFTATGGFRIGGFAVGAAMALFFWVVGRLLRELALMFADLSDASVRTAASLAGQTDQ